jgi:hypothetical protein
MAMEATGSGTGRAASAVLALLALLALSACAGGAEPADPNAPSLAKACAVRPCQCVGTDFAFFLKRQSQPIQWRSNGDAACPEGFRLMLSEPAK